MTQDAENKMSPEKKQIGRPFRKGQSGNPGGRPKVVAGVRDLARRYTVEAIQTLVTICTSGESEAARVSAAQALLARGWGNPEAHVDLDHTVTVVDQTAARERILGQLTKIEAHRTTGEPIAH